MIYLIITNRPKFIPFAIRQAEKCAGVKIVILANGEGFENVKTDHELIYRSEWRHAADAFNWFQKNYKTNDNLFLMDDDIFIKNDVIKETEKYLNLGFDRVVYTRADLYIIEKGFTHETSWRSRSVGGAWAISRDLWRLLPWPDKHADSMLGWFIQLPDHNLKMIVKPSITHLIHDQNIILKDNKKYVNNTPNNPDLLKELKLFFEQ